jgi:DNA-directed RNA polymerase specialized sigma24 family protein
MATFGVAWHWPTTAEPGRVRPDCGEPGGPLGMIVRSCVRRVRNWPVPPNWTGGEWIREVTAHGDAVAHEACCQYDSSYGGEPEVFVRSRVMGRLLTRYRQEWNYARRITPWSVESEEAPVAAMAGAASEDSASDMRQTVIDAVNRLPETDRWLVRQLFWHDRDQCEVARELGVSQPAVSKRYRNIVRQLRGLLVEMSRRVA